MVTRGLLTGKLKREDTKAPEGSRIELGTKLKIGWDNFPDVDKVKQDDKFWEILDIIKKIAEKHGRPQYYYMIYSNPMQIHLRQMLIFCTNFTKECSIRQILQYITQNIFLHNRVFLKVNHSGNGTRILLRQNRFS